MRHALRRTALVTSLFVSVVALTAATQGTKFPIGVLKANEGTNTIAIDFDSTGVVTAYMNDEKLSSGTWQVNADTLTIGTITGPEGYSCASSARYLWSLTENRMTFTVIGTDDCSVRRDPLTGLVWTRG